MPDRAAGTFRITVATLLVLVVMLACQNKMLDMAPVVVIHAEEYADDTPCLGLCNRVLSPAWSAHCGTHRRGWTGF